MTPRSTRGRLRPEARERAALGSAAEGSPALGARVLPLGGQTALAVDADAVRRRVGAWVATRPAGERPAVDALWRDALLAADQVLALARATLGTGGAPLWAVEVRLPSNAHELAGLSGLAPRAVPHVTEALISAEVLDGVSQVGSERVVRLRPEVLTDAPVLAAVRWDVVRARLDAADAPAARLIVRELARRTTTDARAQAHFVSASQRELAEAVGYSKGSMRRHLDALVGAGLIISRSRDRANSWHRLQPVVFDGDPGAPDRSGPPRDASSEPRPIAAFVGRDAASRAEPRRAATVTDLTSSPSPPAPTLPAAASPSRQAPPSAQERMSAVDAALTVEINGVRVALPAGVELTLERDDSGAMWYRAGALRLGPLRFD